MCCISGSLENPVYHPGGKAMFICGLDTQVAKQFIYNRYHSLGETFALNYFHKIFNLTLSMPYSSNIKGFSSNISRPYMNGMILTITKRKP